MLSICSIGVSPDDKGGGLVAPGPSLPELSVLLW